ncbi:type III-B CRISPR module-associated Cmr3 family protein [Thermodesulfobacteriota bacterium B35]
MQPVFLRPVTPVYFGRPGSLSAGEARSGVSWFPPPISAFQGMIRTRLLDDVGVFSPRSRVAELVGTPDSLPSGWQLRGPFPAHAGEGDTMDIWLPMPAFVLKPREWQPEKAPVFARRLGRGNNDHFLTDDQGQGMEPLGNPGAGAEKPLPGWVSSSNLWRLLAGNTARWDANGYGAELPDFVGYEDKIGLARDKDPEENLYLSGRPREGMLYSLRTLRFRENSGLVGWFDGSLAPPLRSQALKRGQVVAGKKGGIMAFSEVRGKDPYWEDIAAGQHLEHNDREPGNDLFWIILLSPGRWQENGADTAAALLARAAGFRDVRLLGMICPDVTWLGGFSLAERRPRPAQPWFAAGTSLLVQVPEADGRDIGGIVRAAWNNRCLLAPEEKRPFGYGHILAANYHEPEEK